MSTESNENFKEIRAFVEETLKLLNADDRDSGGGLGASSGLARDIDISVAVGDVHVKVQVQTGTALRTTIPMVCFPRDKKHPHPAGGYAYHLDPDDAEN